MKKLLLIAVLAAGAVWSYFWYVRGENLLLIGTDRPPAAPLYAYADRIPARSPAKWETAKNMPTARTLPGAAAIGHEVYVAGGYDGFARSLGTFEVFNMRTGEWRTLPAMPARVHAPAVGSDGKRIYVFGGLSGLSNTPSDELWIFDPESSIWTRGADLIDPVGAAAVVHAEGLFHLLGGAGLARSTQAHQVYDPESDRWSVGEPLVSGRDHLAATVLGRRIYAVGGRSGSLLYNLGNTDSLDLSGHDWEQREPLPVKRSAHGLAAIGAKLYAFGGEAASAVFQDMHEYDPGADRWRIAPGMPTARFGFGYAVSEGRIFTAGGGRRSGFSVSDTVEIFTPAP